MDAYSGRATGDEKHRVFKVAAIALATACITIVGLYAHVYLQAYAVLARLSGKPAPGWVRAAAADPLTQRTLRIASSSHPGGISAILYTPVNDPNARGLVLVPGINYKGIEEPRLVAFARSLASCGLRVLTPELPDSRDFRVEPSDIQAIGDSAQWLRNAAGKPVGLMGLSFSGGLALMAAAKSPYSDEVSFVLSIGAHDDLFRVASFYTNHSDPLPNSDVERNTPNPYGPMVLEYEHLEDFTQPGDTAAIRPVLQAQLAENYAKEKQLVAALTPTQKVEFSKLIDTPNEVDALSASNRKHAAEMAAVSPQAHLAGLRAPVYILHGRGDALIPFAEAEWLARDLPRGTLHALVISPLLDHVNVMKKPNLRDRWQILHLLAEVLQRAEHG